MIHIIYQFVLETFCTCGAFLQSVLDVFPLFLTCDFPANSSWLHLVMFKFPVHIVYRAMSWSFLFVSALTIGNIVSSSFRFIDFSLFFFYAFFPPVLRTCKQSFPFKVQAFKCRDKTRFIFVLGMYRFLKYSKNG